MAQKPKPEPRYFPIEGQSDCCPGCGRIYVGPASGYSEYCSRCIDYVFEAGGPVVERRRAMRRRSFIEHFEKLRAVWELTEKQPDLAERLRDLM
jgi:hypothetical protein